VISLEEFALSGIRKNNEWGGGFMKRFLTIAAALGVLSGAVLVATSWPILAQNSGTTSGGMMQGGQMVQGGQMMMSPGLIMPAMNPANGRKLYASKGCVICHSVNGVGGKDAAPLDASTMPGMVNPFDFVANMWRGAEMMVSMQKEELKQQTQFTGQELADIIAFVHDPAEQKKFSEADIPPEIKEHMEK
jgi:mono/diheme cytochrome c family protein